MTKTSTDPPAFRVRPAQPEEAGAFFAQTPEQDAQMGAIGHVREELPHEATTGFWFRTITQDPAVRKAVDDIVYDFYGEENPCREENYNLAPSKEMQMGGM